MGRLVKSKQRVQRHGEVFTPLWMVRKMLDEPPIAKRIVNLQTTILEPSAGTGAFLTEILRRRLQVALQMTEEQFPYAMLWALANVYGIELLMDNVRAARANLRRIFEACFHHRMGKEHSVLENRLFRAMRFIINKNIVQGDMLTGQTREGKRLILFQWMRVDESGTMVQPVPFFMDELTQTRQRKQGILTAFDEEIFLHYVPMNFLDVWAETLEGR